MCANACVCVCVYVAAGVCVHLCVCVCVCALTRAHARAVTKHLVLPLNVESRSVCEDNCHCGSHTKAGGWVDGWGTYPDVFSSRLQSTIATACRFIRPLSNRFACLNHPVSRPGSLLWEGLESRKGKGGGRLRVFNSALLPLELERVLHIFIKTDPVLLIPACEGKCPVDRTASFCVEGNMPLGSTALFPVEGNLALGSTALFPVEGNLALGSTALFPVEGNLALGSTALFPVEGNLALGSTALFLVEGNLALGSTALFLVEGNLALGSTALFLVEGNLALGSIALFLVEGNLALGSTASLWSGICYRAAQLLLLVLFCFVEGIFIFIFLWRGVCHQATLLLPLLWMHNDGNQILYSRLPPSA